MKCVVLLLVGLASLACGCGGAPAEPAVPEPFTREDVERILRLSPLPPPPPDPTNRWSDDPRAAHLGQFLFFDERLSKAGRTSCATCHDPGLEFTDGEPLAEGVLPLDRHTQSLWNVAYNRWFFWDGRADSLWSQALIPLESPLEHAGSRLQLAHVIHGDAELARAYEGIFGPLPDLSDPERFPPIGRPVPEDDHAHRLADEHERKAAGSGHTHGPGARFYHPHQRAWDSMTEADRDAVTRVFVNIGKAIAAYERRLISRRSPFDVFVEGLREHDVDKMAALGDAEKRGLRLFVGEARCHLCHGGPTLSDLEFHDVRIPPLAGGRPKDPGRLEGMDVVRRSPFAGTGRWSDDPDGEARLKIDFLPSHPHGFGEFKTPTLRNVAVTAPYFHQGQKATLEDVIEFYDTLEGAITDPPAVERILRPLGLAESERADLVRFLNSLTDSSLEPSLLRQPDSPVPPTR